MATTTTNFGWDIPQSTDLVKDGATAIAALGQDIDTALVDLKGGTTGQVLAKATNTDLDFTWVAQDDSNAIQNAIVDAKGDLISATAADTPARLAVGTNGQVLTVDSTAATGIKWATPAGGGKVLQMVYATYSTLTTNSTSTYADTGLSATITPTSASSTLLILVNHTNVYKTSGNASSQLIMQLLRGSTQIYELANLYTGVSENLQGSVTFIRQDSPATTSALTYKTQFRNSPGAASVQVQADDTPSSMTILEIGA